MKRYAIAALCMLNIVLAGCLTALWFNPDASLRNVHWSIPSPVSVDYLSSVPLLPARAGVEMGRVLPMTERPLFSATRRPPPPPPPTVAPEEVPVDNLATAKLLGVYEGSGIAGAVLQIAGKNRRVRTRESVEGWTLQSVQGKAVVFERSGQTRTLQLTRSVLRGGGVAPLPPEFLPSAPAASPERGTPAPSPVSNPAAPAPAGAKRFGP